MAAAGLALLAVSAYQMPISAPRPLPARAITTRVPAAQMIDLNSDTLVAVGTLFLGLGGGIGLIAFTENAGD